MPFFGAIPWRSMAVLGVFLLGVCLGYQWHTGIAAKAQIEAQAAAEKNRRVIQDMADQRAIGHAERIRTRLDAARNRSVKLALAHNAAAVIFAHNHPSGIADPSGADEHLTEALQQALGLIDVRLLDHFIVAGLAEPYSFSEHGKLR